MSGRQWGPYVDGDGREGRALVLRVWLIVGAAGLAFQVLPTLGAAPAKPGLRAARLADQ